MSIILPILSAAIDPLFLSFSYVVVFVLGAIIGSFLNVYIYRFHTGKSLAGSSHCLSCGEPLSWFELIPIVSYLGIRGRCRNCKSKVPVRYLLVELLTAVLFVASLMVTTKYVELLLLWFLSAVLVVILTYDYYHFIIPDSLSFTVLAVVAVLQLYASMVYQVPLSELGFDVLAAVAGSGFFLLLWVISKGQWLGFGDVKLVFPLGVLVGAASVFSFIVMSFWIGAIVSLLLLGVQRYQQWTTHRHLLPAALTMKSAVPFAPFLIAGALMTFFLNINVLNFFHFTL